MGNLLILGAGGHGKVVAEIAVLMNKWSEISFLDDNDKLREVNGHKVIGRIKDYKRYKKEYDEMFVAVGDNKIRLNLIEELIKKGFKIPSLIHPFTGVSSRVEIDKGSVIVAGSVVNTNTTIGKGCIINTGSTVGHDCVVDDGVHISPGVNIGGTTYIGKQSWICIGSSVINNINIGQEVVVASGSSVTRDIIDNSFVAGTPAKVVLKVEKHKHEVDMKNIVSEIRV